MTRSEFAKILHSIVIPEGTPPKDINAMVQPISKAISQMMPSSLFRYRRYNKRQVDAFRNDTIYAVTANTFNDPYDTLVCYDQVGIKEKVSQVMSVEALIAMKSSFAAGNDFPEEAKRILPCEIVEGLKNVLATIEDIDSLKDRIEASRSNMLSLIDIYFPILSKVSKKSSTMACFSESIQSVLMWSHYADSHTGFALEYDFRPALKGAIENSAIYPVIYDEERLDVSLYMGWLFLKLIGVNASNPDISSYFKIAIHKSVEWEYEKEWRLIDSTPRNILDDNIVSEIHQKPVAIYYGCNITMKHKRILHKIAQRKGIQEYDMHIDYSSPLFEMKCRKYVPNTIERGK